MWTPPGNVADNPPLRRIAPHDVLYYFDEPLLFISDPKSRLILCYKIDQSSDVSQYILVPTSDHLVSSLRRGSVSLRAALSQSWCWIAEVDDTFNVLRSWDQSIDEVPEQFLPEPKYGLYYEHGLIEDNIESAYATNAFLSMHFKGGELNKKTIGFGTFKNIIEETYHSIWQIFTPALYSFFETERQLRRVVNIPIRQPVFASLLLEIERPHFEPEETSVETPQSDIEQADIRIGQANAEFLDSAEAVTSAARAGVVPREVTRSNLIALEIVSRLAPTDRSHYDVLEISGYIESRERTFVTIGQETGDVIRQAYRDVLEDSKIFEGRVIEVNAQSRSFIIMTPEYRQVTCVMTNGELRASVTSITTGMEVRITGFFEERKRRDKVYVHTLEITNDKPNPLSQLR
jgi:hypothetical protein